jgi:hypothetical protein
VSVDAAYFDNLERSLAAVLSARLGPTDGANVKPGRRSGVAEIRPAVGIAWTRWEPRQVWGATYPETRLRVYCYTEKKSDEQEDHKEEGRFHLAVLTALVDQETIPFLDYRETPPRKLADIRLDWLGGENPPEPQSRSRSETHFDLVARLEEG